MSTQKLRLLAALVEANYIFQICKRCLKKISTLLYPFNLRVKRERKNSKSKKGQIDQLIKLKIRKGIWKTKNTF